MAMARPISAIDGASSAVPEYATPMGTVTMAATVMPQATAWPPCKVEARLPKMMYSAQHSAAPSAYATPTGSRLPGLPCRGSSKYKPNMAHATASKSRGRRDDSMATASGPVTSMATAMPIGISANAR
ncbi:hypothetical protein D3C72_1253440 [compost metagenome]